MSTDFENLVETSNNIAKIKVEAGEIIIEKLTRSSVDTAKFDLANALKSVYELIVDEDYIEDDEIKQNYFDLTDKDDMVSFLQTSKIPDYDGEEDASILYSIKGRGEIKVGRAIKYLCKLKC
jgi:uncharacterized membrane protein YkoI